MKRLDVIQQAIDAIGAGVYLEIGVFTGSVFLRVKATMIWRSLLSTVTVGSAL